MKIFKETIYSINKTFSAFIFGMGVHRIFFAKDYKAASYLFLIVAILFMTGYYTERYGE